MNSNNSNHGLTDVQNSLIKGNKLKVNGYQKQAKLMRTWD